MSDPRIGRIGALLERFSDGDLDAIDALVAPEFFTHVPADGEPTATEIHRGYAEQFRAAAPDLRIAIPDLAPAADGTLAGEAVVSGTLTGALWGVPPTGRRYEFRMPVLVRSRGDGFAFSVTLDAPGALGVLRELGIVNPPDEMHLPPPHPVVIDDFVMRVIFTAQVADKPCSHLGDVTIVRTDAVTCDDCAPDEIWPALRLCLMCGHVGCCDTSTNKHAKMHWEQTGHPLIRSIRMAEGWIWCYEDNAFFQRRTLERLAERLGETV
jgi:predicted ester cyclase